MSRSPVRRTALGALAAAALLTVSACGGDEPEATGPDDASATASASSSGGADDPATEPTPSPTEDTGAADPGGPQPGDTWADAEPTTGSPFTVDSMSVNLPADWPPYDGRGEAGTAVGPTADDIMQMSQLSSTSGTTDQLAESAQEFDGFGPDVERLPDAVVLGQPAYHLRGTDEVFGNLVDQVGFSTPAGDYYVRVGTAQDVPQAQREELLGSVMASLRVDGLP